MRRRNEQAEQRFRLMWRMGVKKVCDESSTPPRSMTMLPTRISARFTDVAGKCMEVLSTGVSI
jgi:hypothetical protein